MGRKLTMRLQHRRRREGKTDYHLRLGLIKSGFPRFVSRRSLSNMVCQIVKHDPSGDKILVSADSKELKSYGWKAGTGNVSASYLTGLLAGVRAKAAGIEDAIFDIGLWRATKGNRLFASLKGALDAGLKVSHSSDILPADERITGKHIASYAEDIKRNDSSSYTSMFSSYLKAGIQPERLPEHFEAVKKAVLEKGASKAKKENERKANVEKTVKVPEKPEARKKRATAPKKKKAE